MKDTTKLFLWSHSLVAVFIYIALAIDGIVLFWLSFWMFFSLMGCDLWVWWMRKYQSNREQASSDAEDEYVLLFTSDEDWQETRSYQVAVRGRLDHCIMTMLMAQESLDEAGTGEVTIVKESYWKQLNG